jgi:hypothetical protein
MPRPCSCEVPAGSGVEQPTKSAFIVDLKTARTLALTIPETVLQRAAEVIEQASGAVGTAAAAPAHLSIHA